MCFDVSIPIRLIWSTDGLPLSEINSNDLILAHSMPRGPSTPTTVVSPAAILVLRRFRVRVRRGVSPTFYRTPILSKVTAPASPHSERSPPSSRRFRPAKCQKCLPQWCLCSSKASCQGVFPKWRLVTRLLGLGQLEIGRARARLCPLHLLHLFAQGQERDSVRTMDRPKRLTQQARRPPRRKHCGFLHCDFSSMSTLCLRG